MSFLVVFAPLARAQPAESEPVLLTSTNYMAEVREALAQAKSSIDIQMYFIISNPRHTDDPVTTLVSDLIQAQARGVAVRVVLEDSKLNANYQACKALMRRGVDVRFDTGASLMHSKVIAVDGKICIIGSANWSRAAIERNHEVGVLVRSAKLATQLAQTFDNIKLRDHIPVLPAETKGVPVPHSLIQAQGGMPALVTDRAEHAFNMYLYLLREAHAQKSNAMPFVTDKLEKDLDCGNVRRPRLRLVETYKLLTYDKRRRQVTLARRKGGGDTFVLPFGYWDYGLWDKLSLRAKFMYLVSLSEAARSSRAPYWFRSQKDMARLYGISDYTISLGLQELEEREIIEIERGAISGPGKHADRKANVYCMNPLMSKEQRQKKLDGLVSQYGKDVIKHARRFAAELNEPDDLDDIQTFADLILKYGYDDVKEANDLTRRMKKGSSRRSIQTTLQILAAPEVER